jgi:uncharacterized protein
MDTIQKAGDRFYIGESPESAMAEITFYPSGEGVITIDHTYVSVLLRGQGIGLRLVQHVVAYAREEGLRIVPLCSFAREILSGNERYADVLA